MRLAWDNKLHESPLNEPHRILDIGTGTGIWAIDMADQYPIAEVVGTDLSPIQPSWVPTNCRFEVDDATLEWTFKDVSTLIAVFLHQNMGSVKLILSS